MASEATIGTVCGIGVGLLVGGLCCAIYAYWKRRNGRRRTKSRRKSYPVPGPTIIGPKIPTFTIPPIIPVPVQLPIRELPQSPSLSPPDPPSGFNGSRRSSVSLEQILTSVSMKESPQARRLSPQAFSTANEPAIASLYNQKKKEIRKKNQLKKSRASSALGKLEYSLFYEQNLNELQVYIVRGIQVYIPGNDGPTDLVIKTAVLYEDREVWQDTTKPTEACNEPDFNEQLIVHGLPPTQMRRGCLRLTLIDDTTGLGVGEVVYPLSNLPFNKFITETSKINEIEEDCKQDKPDGDTYLGELLISMCHNRDEKTLTVGVDCAQGLPQMYGKGSPDSFVKVVVMHFGKKLHSRTTRVVYKSRSPEYSEKFDFVINCDKVHQVTVLFKVKHHGKMRDTSIGMVKLGYDADNELEYRHLEEVLAKPHLSIDYRHLIKKYK